MSAHRNSLNRLCAIASVLTLVLSACSATSNSSNGSGPSVAPSGSSAGGPASPKSGGTLTIAVPADPRTLNPQKDGGYEGNYQTLYIRERLVQLDTNEKVVPSLATSWDTPDPLTYTFHLRPGVKFSNGADFSAEDVKYSFDKITSPDNQSSGNYTPFIKSTSVVDPMTFEVKMKQPWDYFLDQMAGASDFGIMPKGWLESCGADCDTKIVGTGPFMLKEWVKGDKFELARNPNYWDAPRPYLDEVVYKVIPDQATQEVNLKTGAVDLLYYVPFQDAASLKQDSGIEVFAHPAGFLNEIIWNTLVPPFNDTKVRQAMSFAIDTKEIIDNALYGYADVPTDLLPSFHWGHDANAPQPAYDPDKAKQLLSDAGYDSGHPLEFELRTINSSPFTDQATIVQAQLAKIGVQVKVTPMEKSAFLAPMFREPGTDPKSWQAGLERYSFTTDTQSFTWEQYSKDSYINASNINLPGGFQDPKVQELVDAGVAAGTDREKAKDIFAQLYDQAINQDALYKYLSFQQNVQAARTRVHDFHPLTGNQFPLQWIWVDPA